MKLVQTLAYIHKEVTPDGIELYFTHTTAKRHVARPKKMLAETFKLFSFRGTEGSNRVLVPLLNSLTGPRLESRPPKRSFPFRPKHEAKALSIYIFTDGAEEGGSDKLHDALDSIADRLRTSNCPKEWIGIQFIRFGEETQANDQVQRYAARKYVFHPVICSLGQSLLRVLT